MKFRAMRMTAVAALMLAGATLGGCVYYPSDYGYAPGYYAAAPAPVVVVGGGWGWGGGWGHHWR